MAKKGGKGLDGELLKQLDFDLALKRVLEDRKSDFIYAPHIWLVLHKCKEELKSELISALKSGKFFFGRPITIEVPKAGYVSVKGSKRHGPSYTRPGSILPPLDRVMYQLMADAAAPIADQVLDTSRTFGYILDRKKPERMFLPSGASYKQFRSALEKHSANKTHKYILKVDIANCFSSINQHILVNELEGYGYESGYKNFLEEQLLSYAGMRSSRGILQGMFPSDLFGNFYLNSIDNFLSVRGYASSRYVDDIYIFVDSVEHAHRLMHALVPTLRDFDLSLNEAKSRLFPTTSLMTEEPDLEALFQAAVSEIEEQAEIVELDGPYAFMGEDGEIEDPVDLDLAATQQLFDSIDEFPGKEESIERFCLPLFSRCESDYAVPYVLENISKQPAMMAIYAKYLAKFISEGDVVKNIMGHLHNELLFDWQRKWIIATVLQRDGLEDEHVAHILEYARRADVHVATRAVAAFAVGRFGAPNRRAEIKKLYSDTDSHYFQTAILASAAYFPAVEKKTALKAWSGHSLLHSMVADALS